MSEPRPTPEPPAMTSLLAKDAYLQGLAKKICSQPSAEPQKRKSGKGAARGARAVRASDRVPRPPSRRSRPHSPAPPLSRLQAEQTLRRVKRACDVPEGDTVRDAQGRAAAPARWGLSRGPRGLSRAPHQAGSSAGVWRT